MSYQNPRREKIHTGSRYNILWRHKVKAMNEYLVENVGEVKYRHKIDDEGNYLYTYEYCLTIPEVRGEYKRYKNKSYRRGCRQSEIRNYHRSNRQRRKKKLKELNDDIDQKGIGREY